MATTGNHFQRLPKRGHISWWMKKKPVLHQSTKNYKQVLSNYQPVFLLPVRSKIFERLLWNSMYKHISDNIILSPSQSSFCTGDACINQLLSINYGILHSFGEGMETRAIFFWQSLAQRTYL